MALKRVGFIVSKKSEQFALSKLNPRLTKNEIHAFQRLPPKYRRCIPASENRVILRCLLSTGGHVHIDLIGKKRRLSLEDAG